MPFVAVMIFTLLARPVVVSAVLPADVERAIQRAKDYLYSQQKNGIWDVSNKFGLPPGDNGDRAENWLNWGGITALATHALLSAGENPNDPRLKSAIDFLKSADFKGTYALAIRSQVWADLKPNAEIRALQKKDAERLQASMFSKGANRGLWDYTKLPIPDGAVFDHSNSQYAVLGLWAAAESGVEIRKTAWGLMDKAWRENQHPSGAWSYRRASDPNAEFSSPRFTMTAAGVATLFLTNDYQNPGAGINCKGNTQDPNIAKGLAWLAEHAEEMTLPGLQPGYHVYTMERVGVASGLKYFGKLDWYEFGASDLLRRQSPNGGWEDPISTSLNLLFLVHGRAPVIVNKLKWSMDDKSSTPAEVNWNQRPRDAANFVRWMGREIERPLNWQIVDLQQPVEELADAPILYMTGNQSPNLSADDKSKLRTFVENGGLILGVADCGSANFANGFRKLGQELFPMYEFRELPADHIIYTGQQYQRKKWKSPPSVLGLSNGVRELMVLAPTADLGKSFQTQDYKLKSEAFQLVSNLAFYTNESKSFRGKGEGYWIARDDRVTNSNTVKLARLQYAGNWNPEPGGWRRVANYMHTKRKIDLQVETIKLGEGKLDSSFQIAHLTGTSSDKLPEAQLAELKKFVDGGGVLIVDAAGGSTAFAASIEAQLPAIMPEAKTRTPLPATHPMLSGATKLSLRPFATRSQGKSAVVAPAGVERQGRVGIVYSPLDLSLGLMGQSFDGIVGYSPESALGIVSGVIEAVSRAK